LKDAALYDILKKKLIRRAEKAPGEDSALEGNYRHISFRVTLLACAIGVMCPLDVESAFASAPQSCPSSATELQREAPGSRSIEKDPFCASMFGSSEGRAGLTPEMIEKALDSIKEPVFTPERSSDDRALFGMVNCQCECNCACNACGDCSVSCGMCSCPCAACNACDTCDCCGGAFLQRRRGALHSRRSL